MEDSRSVHIGRYIPFGVFAFSGATFEWVIPASSGKELDTDTAAVRFTVKGIQGDLLPTKLDGTKCQDHEAWFSDNRAAPTTSVRLSRDVSTRTRRTGGRSNRSIRLCAPIFTVL